MRSSLWTVAALCAVVAAAVGASGGCAKGTEFASGNGAAGPGGAAGQAGASGASGAAGGVGMACETDQECPDGSVCLQIGGEKICTRACPPECPQGSYCTLVEGDPYCVPDRDQQCGQCQGSAQCKGITDECLAAPAGDKFCARDCTTMDDCPSGFTCMERADYLALAEGSGGSGGGSSASTGTSSSTGAGGTTSGTGGSMQGAGGMGAGGAGMMPPAGIPHKFCVPPDLNSCACNEKRDGVTKSCDKKNEFGYCPGSETCDGKGGAWVGCDAKTPAAEVCNNDDDNCDGAIDEGDGSALCGGAPPHAAYACNAGSCDLGPCEPGWTQYPAGKPGDGCTCALDASEPNDSCAAPGDAGSVSDNGAGIQIAGTMSSDSDVDVWTFQTVDTDEVTTNSYHVSISVMGAEGSDTILLDVIRGDACAEAPSGPAAGITSYDWCVDGKSADGTAGEAPCGAQDAVHCNNNSAKYFVRVYRKAGAPSVCLPYTIQVAAKGGNACDFTQKCP